MVDTKNFLVDVETKDLPFPMRVISKKNSGGQPTVANISISARIMQEFEARWIDRFIRVLHQHRDSIGTGTLRTNSEKKSSVVLTDEIKNDLRHHPAIEWYAVRCANYGMLHSYNTVVSTEKSYWVPFSGYEQEI
ncbi:MAG: hypothetical protein WBM69_16390 [Desulfobacterales bacterium]